MASSAAQRPRASLSIKPTTKHDPGEATWRGESCFNVFEQEGLSWDIVFGDAKLSMIVRLHRPRMSCYAQALGSSTWNERVWKKNLADHVNLASQYAGPIPVSPAYV
jgi:hypothetical protein